MLQLNVCTSGTEQLPNSGSSSNRKSHVVVVVHTSARRSGRQLQQHLPAQEAQPVLCIKILAKGCWAGVQLVLRVLSHQVRLQTQTEHCTQYLTTLC
jgi:hypothetical protein